MSPRRGPQPDATRCLACRRPNDQCFCDAIPTIANQTEIVLVQHPRERTHPFNTARIVQRALTRSQLMVDQLDRLSARLHFAPRTGLLYPGPDAPALEDLSPSQRPEHLVIVDGTWHHAHAMVRDLPALRALPQYGLRPQAPSAYRIRREPRRECLSTLEATVAALRLLEPGLSGLDQLLAVFCHMVERQLAFPHPEAAARRLARRRITSRNVPTALLGDLGKIVVAYGESWPRDDVAYASRPPVVWAAQRLLSGERFYCVIQPEEPPASTALCHWGLKALRHWDLTAEEFSAAISLATARRQWEAFTRTDDALVVYHPHCERLYRQLTSRPAPCYALKAIHFRDDLQGGTLEEVLRQCAIVPGPAVCPGRAGERLARAVALVHYLHRLDDRTSGAA